MMRLASHRFGPVPTDARLSALGYLPWQLIDGLGQQHRMGWVRPDLLTSDLCHDLRQGTLPLAALPGLSSRLQQSPAGQGWRNEQFVLCNDVGEPIVDQRGQAVGLERSLFRPLGLFYITVQLNLLTADGRVWVAQRAQHKAVDPGLWDAAVAGGVAMGEDPLSALQRECWEEAGLPQASLGAMEPLGSVMVQRALGLDERQGLQRELVMSYRLTAPSDWLPSNQDGEVQAFECVSLEDIWRRWQLGQFNHEAAVGCLDFLVPQPD
jgi:8-oxo-dGTP pyrophosphatase MutT (NUDIX family)